MRRLIKPIVSVATAFLTGLWLLAATAAEQDPLTRAQTLLNGLTADAPTTTYANTARNFGALVDEVRQQSAPDDVLVKLRKLASNMRKQTEARLQAAENATGGDEAALERSN
jgi:hypothetical protein